MAETTNIDARGLSCPLPAMQARDALKKLEKGTLEVIVDNETAVQNVSRIARNLGWNVTPDEKSDEEIHLVITK